MLDVGCGAGVLAIAAAKVLRHKVWLGDIDPIAVEVANANARLNGVGELCRAVVSRGVENLTLRDGAPYDVVFANILARPLKLLAPSLAAVIAPGRGRDRLGPPRRRRSRRARLLAGAGFFPCRPDRSRGLVEP